MTYLSDKMRIWQKELNGRIENEEKCPKAVIFCEFRQWWWRWWRMIRPFLCFQAGRFWRIADFVRSLVYAMERLSRSGKWWQSCRKWCWQLFKKFLWPIRIEEYERCGKHDIGEQTWWHEDKYWRESKTFLNIFFGFW